MRTGLQDDGEDAITESLQTLLVHAITPPAKLSLATVRAAEHQRLPPRTDVREVRFSAKWLSHHPADPARPGCCPAYDRLAGKADLSGKMR
jgi:hypothetical protein